MIKSVHSTLPSVQEIGIEAVENWCSFQRRYMDMKI